MQEMTVHAPERRSWPAWRARALAGLAGIAQTLAFAPRDAWWLQLLAAAALFALVERTASRRDALWLGGGFGVASFVSGIWWLYISMHTYGGMPGAMAGAAVVLFSVYLAIYPALAAFFTRWVGATGPWRALAFAGAWTLAEWLRGTVFTGFPWLSPGYAHVDGPLAGFAPLVGVYGIGGLAALAAAWLARGVLPAHAGARPARRLAAVLGVLILLGAGAGLARHAWTSPSGTPLTVRLLQGNVAQDMKFERAGIEHAMAMYRDMIVAAPADLIITPETAFPVLLQGIPPEVAGPVREFADRTGSHVVLGAVGATLTERGPTDLTNSLFGVTPRDQTLYRYDKHHLVPFGEFIPWGFRWFVEMMHIPLGDFRRGTATPSGFPVRGQRVALDICYEDLFGEEIARSLREVAEPATVLANATNLAWFGDTIALDQHLQIARMRTLETGRPMLRATNTGASAIIDAHGRVQGRLPTMTTGALTGSVQPYSGLTPYVRFGNGPALGLAIVALGLGLAMTRRKR
ncbi:apolipoprotein N-acyltransferase [Pandoraea nosoerga]|uniref:Apolipoprotein N-acyltransferase n=2 Tax=Pandoraea nosoerga TaxID=2508296 RepID=A0A5E4TCA2_9BURK|nr:apolipoprotein N-acyltransferase [Pandoraea nosoerga]MBN4675418.1 apolipoprotein N-acyltransferase [Pandoraea nosoerga]MBN4679260.1 apolipoprotein N-acyltransferase [Pandoraea nosoerga]MBN4743742.1 apolipoprotein N-acyltransferase [Pandoraea nosoerga]VVD84922.1 apolipoprotein N-acyltransferase [Pandoraea nosoerga]